MVQRNLIRLLFVLGTIAGTTPGAMADTVQLKNGDVLTGKVVSFDAKKLKLTTSYAGDVAVAVAEVDRLTTDEPMILKWVDGRETAGRIVTDADGSMRVDDGQGGVVPLALAEVSSFAPVPPPRPWFRRRGEINVGFTGATGNTETQGYHVSGQARPEFGNNTFTISGQLNRSEAEIDGTTETTASNWRVLAQYDRFFTEHWYWFLNNGWENDDLKDLNVRISAATGPGYKFWDEELRYLSVEIGPGFIYENFRRVLIVNDVDDPSDDVVINPDRDYITGRWALDFNHAVFDPGKRFFHNHILLVRADNADTFLFQSSTGLRVNLIASLSIGAEVQFDWNNDPADGAKKEDLRYLLTLGYAF
jgi:putative salt-induced outer membrane protein YdiY